MIASAWSSDQLGNLVNFKTGKLNSNAAVSNGRYPFFTCSQETYRTNTCAFDTECVLLAGNNANGIYPLKYFKGKFDAYQRTYIVTPLDASKLSTRFLYFAMRPMLEYMRSISTGAATKFLTLTILKGLDFQFPALPTQRKIASILSAYDDLIENNTRRIAILEEMAQAIYREWFVNFRFPGHEDVKLVDSPLGQIPEGWEVVTLPQLCSKLTDGTHDSPKECDEGYPLVTGKHLNNGVIEFERCYLISSSDHEEVMRRCRPESGDIIFSNIGTLGNTVLVDGDHEFSIKNVALFKPLDRPNSHFLFLYLSQKATLESMIQRASGTSQKFLSLTFLRSEPVVYPSQEMLRLFDDRVSALIAQRAILHKTNQNLRTTRDLLLPKLISGALDVEDLDIDVGMTTEAKDEVAA